MGLYRKVIRVTAEDSPNVRFARAQISRGYKPTNEIIVPGILPWSDFVTRTTQWDEVKKTISLRAEFYKGADKLLYPPDWLDRAEHIAHKLASTKTKRIAKAMGIDPAEGGDKTTFAIGDELGLINLISKKTPNTRQVVWDAIAIGEYYNIPPEMWCFDRGGGGKEHADSLEEMGYEVDTIAFGESATIPIHPGVSQFEEREKDKHVKDVYLNRRAEIYWLLRKTLDPSLNELGWGIPARIRGKADEQSTELRPQMALIPISYNKEGVLYILPKNKKSPDSKEKCLSDIIGHSPDELDAVAILAWKLFGKHRNIIAG